MGKRELIALVNLSSWCLVMVERLFLAVPRGCLQFVIVVFPDHTYLLFFYYHLYTGYRFEQPMSEGISKRAKNLRTEVVFNSKSLWSASCACDGNIRLSLKS